MDWATDLEITSKKLIPRLGRRAGQNFMQEDSKSDDDLLNSPMSFSSGYPTQPPVAPPRARKTGWGDDLKGSKTKASSNIIEQDRFRSTRKENPLDDIPVIPDLDEIQEDNVVSDLSSAPMIDTNRVTAYKELDTDLIKNEAFTSLDGISLFSLTEKLYNENLVKEAAEAWNWNLLFTQVASRLTYSITPQFGNRGSSRSDVKTQPCRRAYPRAVKSTSPRTSTRNRESNTSYVKRPRDNTH